MRNLVIVLVCLVGLSCIWACSGEKETEMRAQQEPAMESHEGHDMHGEMAMDMVVDPVCDMKIKKEEAVATADYEGKTYYFCMAEHKTSFNENPGKYVN